MALARKPQLRSPAARYRRHALKTLLCTALAALGLAAGPAQFFGGGEFDVEDVVAGNSATITAAGGGGYCGIERLHGVVLLVFCAKYLRAK